MLQSVQGPGELWRAVRTGLARANIYRALGKKIKKCTDVTFIRNSPLALRGGNAMRACDDHGAGATALFCRHRAVMKYITIATTTVLAAMAITPNAVFPDVSRLSPPFEKMRAKTQTTTCSPMAYWWGGGGSVEVKGTRALHGHRARTPPSGGQSTLTDSLSDAESQCPPISRCSTA